MAEARHGSLTTNEGIHIPYQYTYATSALRNAATLTGSQLGKLARQTDDDSLWMLTASPATWTRISGSGYAPGGAASGDLTGTYPSPVVSKASSSFGFTGDISASISASQDNWNPTGLGAATVIRVSASNTGASAIGGLDGGTDGRIVAIHNIDSIDFSLMDEHANSSASCRFALSGCRLRLFPDSVATLQYDSSSCRYRCIGHSGAYNGQILQVQSTIKTDTFNTTSTSFTALTGLSVSITPRSTTSKVLVRAILSGEATANNAWRLMRDATPIGIGDAASARSRASGGNLYDGAGTVLKSVSGEVLDSPASVSAIAYSVDVLVETGFTLYINRTPTDTDSVEISRGVSTITAMEICQ